MKFQDRSEAGRLLADRLIAYSAHPDVIVLALPRGGVPVAFEVASALDVPLDIFLVRKFGVPGYEELALGAISTGGVRVVNTEIARDLGLSDSDVEVLAAAEQRELARREEAYRGNRPPPSLRDRIVILVDDGLATGATMQAAVAAVRKQHPARVTVAVPVGSREAVDSLAAVADEVACIATPDPFRAVGFWYEDFT